MTKLFITIITVCLFASSASAQSEGNNMSIGLRLTPTGLGVTDKMFFSDRISLDAQVNVGNLFTMKSMSLYVVGLAAYNIQLSNDSWRPYFGIGFHGGLWDRYSADSFEPMYGLDAVAGLEYSLPDKPFTFGVETCPAINLEPSSGFFPQNIFALTAKFNFRGKYVYGGGRW